ncbi:FAD-dependent oxidoreductase [Devosia neptuniae]|uniref:FAD-dependent oxidoreductase n=1 Tax=Devosia neptuniae TaxID=191302 RepID=A0ABY6CIA2_9HYPH|nr:FAD-dependent oxidoreductase [Devosia neptuniae]UXN69778.1 FAD-dependent oxidoreductase [Devosia neptuniae]
MSQHYVIVGAGECGARAAMALREQGFAGDVTLVGGESHLPYERPPLSKEGMLAELFAAKTIATAERLAEAGIAFRGGLAVAGIDREGKRLEGADGRVIGYDKLLLATGAAPRRLPGVEGERIVYLRTIEDALRLREALGAGRHLAVIGGGFIGLELAASARLRGAEVTLIEALPRLLSRGVPEAMARQIEARHLAGGVKLVFGDGIAGIASGAESAVVTLASGRRIEADLVLVGIGAVPNVTLAEGAGLAIENGIAVDRHLATGDPDIFAAGDCCSFPLEIYGGRRVRLESWRNAQDQGNLAARNMLGAGEAISSVPWFWSDQYELTLQIAGLSGEGTTVVRRELEDGASILFHLAADGRLVAASGLGVGNAVARDIRLAEMLIGKRARPDVAALGDAGVKLKGLLAAA